MKTLFTLCLLVLIVVGKAQVKITGKVLDNKNRPLAGISIVLKDTYDGATSDSAGNFSFITTEKGDHVFEVSSSGYRPYEQKININFKQIYY